ncbi:MAG: hypothetical protein ABJF10_19750 [Chthoniobacter sp.]|uniref:hypothetical protein n=1 Tax=Chthoniobacter sp. TaxID=2510640 RepID=UPI0032A4530E
MKSRIPYFFGALLFASFVVGSVVTGRTGSSRGGRLSVEDAPVAFWATVAIFAGGAVYMIYLGCKRGDE